MNGNPFFHKLVGAWTFLRRPHQGLRAAARRPPRCTPGYAIPALRANKGHCPHHLKVVASDDYKPAGGGRSCEAAGSRTPAARQLTAPAPAR